jgi:hypothetical protein
MRFRACTIDSSLQGPRSFIGVVALVLCRATPPFGCRTGSVPGLSPATLWPSRLLRQEKSMSVRDRRSQRIRDQLRSNANPRNDQRGLQPRTLQEQLRRTYAEDNGGQQPDLVTAELLRLTRRRR